MPTRTDRLTTPLGAGTTAAEMVEGLNLPGDA